MKVRQSQRVRKTPRELDDEHQEAWLAMWQIDHDRRRAARRARVRRLLHLHP